MVAKGGVVDAMDVQEVCGAIGELKAAAMAQDRLVTSAPRATHACMTRSTRSDGFPCFC
jgi:hypothetical protein